MPMPRMNLVGHRFTRLTVVEFAGQDSKQQSIFKCVCDCGNEIAVKGFLLKRKKCILSDDMGLGKTTSTIISALETKIQKILIILYEYQRLILIFIASVQKYDTRIALKNNQNT